MGATFWVISKSQDAALLHMFCNCQQLTHRWALPPKNGRHQFGNPKMSNFGSVLAYIQEKAHLAIPKLSVGAMICPN